MRIINPYFVMCREHQILICQMHEDKIKGYFPLKLLGVVSQFEFGWGLKPV